LRLTLESITFAQVTNEYSIDKLLLWVVPDQSYVVAETTMSGSGGFDFSSSGEAFNTLAAYLFGKVQGSDTKVLTFLEHHFWRYLEVCCLLIHKNPTKQFDDNL